MIRLSDLRARLDALATGAPRADLASLGVLAAGAVTLLGVLWWLVPGEEAPAAGDGSVDVEADADAAPAVAGEGGADAFAEGQADPAEDGAPLELRSDDVVVHVSGEVADPGLRELSAGARVGDAVEAAGGAGPHAALDGLNLARPLRDGEQVHVPHVDEARGSGADGGDGAVRVNQADAGELEAIPGVGPVLAERIIVHREEHGPFVRPEDLLEVSGIGERMLEALADHVDL